MGRQILKSLVWVGMILSTGCAHYSAVQMGSGNFSGRQVFRCSDSVFTFPINNTTPRIDLSLEELGLKQNDVYSIEQRDWNYFYPIYFYHCSIISLNTEGARKVPDAEYIKDEDRKANGVANKPKKPKLDRKQTHDALEKCDALTPLARDRCREEILSP